MNLILPWRASCGTSTGQHVRSRIKRVHAAELPTLPSTEDVPSLVTSTLGPLECEVLDCVCRVGECSARDVLVNLQRPLAYTTVSTTLARLRRKRLLDCRPLGTRFYYRARLTLPQVELQFARDLARAISGCKGIPVETLATIAADVTRTDYPELCGALIRALLREVPASG